MSPKNGPAPAVAVSILACLLATGGALPQARAQEGPFSPSRLTSQMTVAPANPLVNPPLNPPQTTPVTAHVIITVRGIDPAAGGAVTVEGFVFERDAQNQIIEILRPEAIYKEVRGIPTLWEFMSLSLTETLEPF